MDGVKLMNQAAIQTPDVSSPDDVHVMPEFGRSHRCASNCWCEPKPLPETLDRTQYRATVWVHEVEQ